MAHERAREKHLTRTLAGPLRLASVLTLLLLAPGSLRAQAGADSLLLHWTSPGDDGLAGTAAEYDLRYSSSPMDESNYAQATALPGLPAPAPARTQQSFVVRGLSRSTSYWFAMRTRDAAGNWSPLSNVLRWDWPLDTSPPAAPAAMQAALLATGKSVRLSWRANAESDLGGYHVYRAMHGSSSWQRLTTVPLSQPSYVDDALPADAGGGLDYAVTALDVNSNESARSATVTIVLSPTKSTAVTHWDLEPPYPNPSRIGEVARFPISLPPSSAAVRLELRDENDVIVRRLDVSDPAGGRREVVWDGRNDHGQACAPGVYRAWLIASGFKRMVRVARVP